jgi:flagellar basal-body rod modification protein FlgD
MASPVNPLTGSPDPASNSGTSTLGGAAPNEEMFLRLLVSQLQNQDPLNPTDSTQFVTQLAQFSELEQVIAIRGDIEKSTAANQTTTNLTSPVNGQVQS